MNTLISLPVTVLLVAWFLMHIIAYTMVLVPVPVKEEAEQWRKKT